MSHGWRWLEEPRGAPSGTGPWNMGLDEALLSRAASDGVATLRLYQWSGPWLSLGYGQRLGPARQRACEEAGVGVVRRWTGGRAVLHGADLTYSVAAPAERFPAGLRGSYARLGHVLSRVLAGLGVQAEPVCPRPPDPGAPPVPRAHPGSWDEFDCFAQPAPDELCVGGRKLVGSAQRRVPGAFLQHGSLRLGPDPPRVAHAVGMRPGAATSLRELGVRIGAGDLAERMARAFGEVLGVDLERAPATAGELAHAGRRRHEPPPPRDRLVGRQAAPSSAQLDRR